MQRTGMFLTAAEITHVKELINTPVILINGRRPREAPDKYVDRVAMSKGLPDLKTRTYGADLSTGAIVRP